MSFRGPYAQGDVGVVIVTFFRDPENVTWLFVVTFSGFSGQGANVTFSGFFGLF